jgi:hypothetical protein
MHQSRVSHPWEDIKIEATKIPVDTGIDSLDLSKADLAALLAEMDVDHTVRPVAHTVGGSTHGYTRWSAWVAAGGLKTYAKRRNDSMDAYGVSRMSAYLNAGMVSPLRLAREASAASGAGKSKFLNEFLTWRGLTYAWCYHFPMPSAGCTLSQLPKWAKETLQKHALDPRPVILSRDQLAQAHSGDRAWDGMQRYLVETGELHNNARMGWGCAIPKWTTSPQIALNLLVDLNNTFALDGHAPPSYGGLLGCLGLFSGPKGESAIFGKVSARSPKMKYAAMPSQIPMLIAGVANESLSLTQKFSLHHTGQEDLSGPPNGLKDARDTPAGRRALPSSFVSTREAETQGGDEEAAKYSKGRHANFGDASLKKRRWSNLKMHSENAVIEIE